MEQPHNSRYPEITESESLVVSLKNAFYPTAPWSKVAIILASMLTKLKIEARKYFPEQTEVERLRRLSKFSSYDLYETLMIPMTDPEPRKGSAAAFLGVSFKFDITDPRKGEANADQTAKTLLDGLQGPVRPST